jgi:hypothetical protein
VRIHKQNMEGRRLKDRVRKNGFLYNGVQALTFSMAQRIPFKVVCLTLNCKTRKRKGRRTVQMWDVSCGQSHYLSIHL